LITWTAPPSGTAELALSVVDPDAQGFVHWLIIGLPGEAGSVGGGEPLVDGAAEATNGFGVGGWGGPCPPPGAGPHTYEFTLHVLDQQIELPAETPTNELLTAVEAATASSATFTGSYERA
jgi:Raf kinase inhibitor-like YbhB/YbcL family protein